MEKVSRAILIYSLGHYKGDERIKEFIWDLVSPSGETVLKNHSGKCPEPFSSTPWDIIKKMRG